MLEVNYFDDGDGFGGAIAACRILFRPSIDSSLSNIAVDGRVRDHTRGDSHVVHGQVIIFSRSDVIIRTVGIAAESRVGGL
jgi:hypothetical protein